MSAGSGKGGLFRRAYGFSLVEVVLALGLTVFALLVMLGLFTRGIEDVGSGQRRVEAANALNSILESRLAAPANVREGDVLPAIDLKNLPLKGTAYVSVSGNKAEPDQSRFQLTYEIWAAPESSGGASFQLVRIHLLASWPAGAAPAKAAGATEMITSAYVRL